MGLKLSRRSLQIERVAGEGSAETVAEGTVRLSERHPPIGRALQLTAHPIVNNIEPTDDRVLVEGIVRLELTYAAFETVPADDSESEEDERVVERLYRAVWDDGPSFAYLLELDGATEESEVSVRTRSTAVNYDVRGDDESVDVDVVLELTARLEEIDHVTLTVGVEGDGIDADYEEVRVRSRLGEIKGNARITSSLSLGGRSLPDSVLSVKAEANFVEVTHAEGEAIIRGYVDCNSLYVGTEGAGAQFVEWPKSASFEISVPFQAEDVQVHWEPQVEVTVADFYVEDSEDGSAIRLDAQVTVSAVAYRSEIVSCLMSVASSEGEVASRLDHTVVYEAIGEGSTRSELSGVLELADTEPAIDRLLDGTANFVVQEVHVLGDRVAIEGQVAVELLYVGRGESGDQLHLARWPYAITADMEVPLPGAEPGLDREITVNIRRVEFDLINRETVEVKVQVAADAQVGRMRQVDMVVEAVNVPPEDDEHPTFTFVFANEDDTLWKLAQLYRTSVEDILAHNEWIDGDEPVLAGHKVCIVH